MRNTQTSKTRNLLAGGLALGAIVALALPAIAGDTKGLIVDQGVVNSGDVTISSADIKVWGGLTGTGASASVNATGAATSVAASTINTNYIGSPVALAEVRQHAENSGYITSLSNSIKAGALTGKGASVNISASGAVNSVAVSAIDSPVNATFSRHGKITQTANNSGSVITSGTISVGRLSGSGVSVGISAAGATSAILFSRIR